jgi:hypothetical protein
MPSAVIDACCLIDVLASGYAEAVLRAAGCDWHLPVAVQREVQFVRQRDPDQPAHTIVVAADVDRLISSEVLSVCKPEDDRELDRFTRFAAAFRSDGEAMCIALAESRGWIVATDDRKAIRVGREAGLTIVSSPQLMKTWADKARPYGVALTEALRNIEFLAQFRPNPSMPEYQWWIDRVGEAGS